MSEKHFDKYDIKGAYHWPEYYGGLRAMNAYTKARYDMIAEILAEAPAGPIADIGCGDGVLASIIGRNRPVIGVDTNEKAIGLARQEFARRGLSGEFRVSTSYRSPIDDASVAVAVSSDVIEHVAEPAALLDDMKRILKPGGWAILTTPIKVSDRPFDPLHVQEWLVPDFVALCEAHIGTTLRVIRSHPLFWYELQVSRNPWVLRSARLVINAMTKLGRNPYRQMDPSWRVFTTQCVVVAKPQ